jgi:hypothetical protein
MVSVYEAYKAINQSLADLANSINELETTECSKADNEYVRLEEEEYYITERGRRLASNLTAAYDLPSYRKNFYMMDNQETATILIEELVKPIDNLDLTEFSMESGES